MRTSIARSTLLLVALVSSAAQAAAPPMGKPSIPTKKGGVKPAIPACWREVADDELAIRGQAANLVSTMGGDASDRTSRAGALQAHARQSSLAWFAAWGYPYLIILPWHTVYYAPKFALYDCSAIPGSKECVALAGQLAAKAEIAAARERNANDETTATRAIAQDIAGSGAAPAIRAQAAALAARLDAFENDSHTCFASLVPKSTGTGKEPASKGGKLRFGDGMTVIAPEGAIIAAADALAIASAEELTVLASDLEKAKALKVKLRDALVVLSRGDGAFPVPTGLPPLPATEPITPPDPLAGADVPFPRARLSGDLELTIGGKQLRIDDATIDAGPDGVKIGGRELSLGGCKQRVGIGSRFEAGKLVLQGRLACGDLSGTATLRLGRSLAGNVTATLFGHDFTFDLGFGGGELEGSTTWRGSSTDWQSVPGLDLELRVDGPEVVLAMKGSAVSFTFDANKLELRSKSKKPDGTPWAYAMIDPPSRTFAADGELSFLPPSLPTPSDAFAAARGACIDVAKTASPPGKVRDAAIGVCNGKHPSPPSIPAPPTSIDVQVKVVIK